MEFFKQMPARHVLHCPQRELPLVTILQNLVRFVYTRCINCHCNHCCNSMRAEAKGAAGAGTRERKHVAACLPCHCGAGDGTALASAADMNLRKGDASKSSPSNRAPGHRAVGKARVNDDGK